MREWQPIETAPRDGEWLLVWASGAEIPAVAHWLVENEVWATCEDEEYLSTEYNTEVSARLQALKNWGVEWWMPLPEPPE